MRLTAGLILTPPVLLALLTGLLLVSGNVSLLAAWERLRCELPEMPNYSAAPNGSPTLIEME